jgi:hypothetical protein
MKKSADSPSQRRGEHENTYVLLVAVFVLSALAFGYGFAVFAGVLPAMGLVAIFEYVLLVIGGLSSTLTGLAAAWLWRQEQPHPLTGRLALLMSSIASAVPLGAILLSAQFRFGEFTVPRVFGWTTVGVLVLSSQFAVGAINPKQRTWHVLLTECGVVFTGVSILLTLSGGERPIAANLSIAAVGTVLFLVFAGPLYLLGHHLSDVSR